MLAAFLLFHVHYLGGVGRFGGHLISLAGGVLAIPSALMTLPYLYANRDSLAQMDENSQTVSTLGKVYLGLAGMQYERCEIAVL